jgi:hypothetical protein
VGPRALLLLFAVVAAAGGWLTVQARGAAGLDDATPVTVGKARIEASALEAVAAKTAGKHADRLPAARVAAADRAIERVWLEGEAAERGLRPAAAIDALRGQVADALAGPGHPPTAAQLAAVFEDFHARWRAVTGCLPAYQDPYEDRCGNVARAATGTCRWMGEATLCQVPGRWLVVRAGRRTERFRSHRRALDVARAAYVAARAERAARAADRRAAADRARARAALAARRRDPRLAGVALTTARDACHRQLQESDPYMFGFGMQDTVGYAEGLIAVRTAFVRRVAGAASDRIDREKLAPLIAAVRAGNRELTELAAAELTGNTAAVTAGVARFDARTAPERTAARRLGLGDCLARPAA